MFDEETGEEVTDIATHQAQKRAELAKRAELEARLKQQAAVAPQEYNEDFYGSNEASSVPVPAVIPQDDMYDSVSQPKFVRPNHAASANPPALAPRGHGSPIDVRLGD